MKSRWKYPIALLAMVALGCQFLASTPALAEEDPPTLAESLAAAKEQGRPLMILGTAHACGSCVILKKRLQSEEAIQESVAQFVHHVVYLDEDQQLEPFMEQFELSMDDLAAPMMYVVNADGEHVATKLGLPAGDELGTFLSEALKKANAKANAKKDAS